MAPRKRNKQDELNRTYRNADVGRVGSSLRNQGYSQNNKGNTYYTVGGVKYDAATGRPAKNQAKPAPKPQPAAAPRPAAVTSGGGRGGSATPPASRATGGGGAAKTSSSGGGGGTSKIHTYKEHGSDLHVGRHKTLAEHRAAVEKAKGGGGNSTPASTSTNTASNGKEYHGPGGGPNSNPAKQYNTPDEKSKYVAPNGQPYQGPGYGNDQVASKKPAETKDKETKVETKPQRKISAGDQRYMSEAERRRKGISNVIG